MLNRTTLFAYARRAPFGGKLSSKQVAGIDAILDAWEKLQLRDLRWLAYILATAFHETGATMQPIREAHGASDAQTIARLDREWAKPGHGALRKVSAPYWRQGWFGRGFVQLTHKDNYARMSGVVGVDLVADPARAMDLDVAARILILGMVRGMFRGRRDPIGGDSRPECLADYFGNAPGDPEGARAIVNGGGDKAKLIAGYYTAFKGALDAASEMTAQPKDVAPEAAKPDDVPASGGKITAAAGVGLGATLLSAISNPYALAAFALVLIAAGLWAWRSGFITVNRKVAT